MRCQSSPAAQNDFRRPAWLAAHDDILERGADTESRAESLQHRLLGGEPAGKPFDPIETLADLRESSAVKQRGTSGPRESSIHRRSAATSTISIPCPITFILHGPSGRHLGRRDETTTIKCSEEIGYDDGIRYDETLIEHLAGLIEPFSPERIDCAAYNFAGGPDV